MAPQCLRRRCCPTAFPSLQHRALQAAPRLPLASPASCRAAATPPRARPRRPAPPPSSLSPPPRPTACAAGRSNGLPHALAGLTSLVANPVFCADAAFLMFFSGLTDSTKKAGRLEAAPGRGRPCPANPTTTPCRAAPRRATLRAGVFAPRARGCLFSPPLPPNAWPTRAYLCSGPASPPTRRAPRAGPALPLPRRRLHTARPSPRVAGSARRGLCTPLLSSCVPTLRARPGQRGVDWRLQRIDSPAPQSGTPAARAAPAPSIPAGPGRAYLMRGPRPALDAGPLPLAGAPPPRQRARPHRAGAVLPRLYPCPRPRPRRLLPRAPAAPQRSAATGTALGDGPPRAGAPRPVAPLAFSPSVTNPCVCESQPQACELVPVPRRARQGGQRRAPAQPRPAARRPPPARPPGTAPGSWRGVPIDSRPGGTPKNKQPAPWRLTPPAPYTVRARRC
jgi:hypothetical protein